MNLRLGSRDDVTRDVDALLSDLPAGVEVPVLSRLWSGRAVAHSTLLCDEPRSYTQIIRVPFGFTAAPDEATIQAERRKALIEFIRTMDIILLWGEPSVDVSGAVPMGYATGIVNAPYALDRAVLCFLSGRGPTEYIETGEDGSEKREFLAEFGMRERGRGL